MASVLVWFPFGRTLKHTHRFKQFDSKMAVVAVKDLLLVGTGNKIGQI